MVACVIVTGVGIWVERVIALLDRNFEPMYNSAMML